MANKKSIGLPGGPNEFLQDITQYISVDGYKRHSDDKINPVNIIESGSITMEDVDFPVYGVDNLGNEQMMFPENDYQFPGDIVMEMPMLAKNGRELPKAQFGRNSIMSGNAYGLRPEGSTGVLGDIYKKTGFDKFGEEYIPETPQHTAISGLLDIINIPANLATEAVEYFGERGDKEFNFSDAMPGFSGDFSFTNANDEPIKTVSQTTDADGNPLVEGFWSGLAIDILTDPTSWIGAGLIKNFFTKGSKVLPKKVISKTMVTTKELDNIVEGGGDMYLQLNNLRTKFPEKAKKIGLGTDKKIKKIIINNPKTAEKIINSSDAMTSKVKFLDNVKIRVKDDLMSGLDYYKLGHGRLRTIDPDNLLNSINKMGDDGTTSLYRYGDSPLNAGGHSESGWFSADPMDPFRYQDYRGYGKNVFKIDVENHLLNDIYRGGPQQGSTFNSGTTFKEFDVPDWLISLSNKTDIGNLSDYKKYLNTIKKHGGSLPEAQWGALGKAAKPVMKKGISYLKSFFDDAVEVTDDVVEKVVKKNPITESVANTPKTLDRPPAEDYIFYRNTDDGSSIMKPLNFVNTRKYNTWEAPQNLSFFSPNNRAFDGYGANKFGAKINPKKPFYEYSAKTYSVEDVQKLIDQGYDAIVTNYDKPDIRDAYQVIPLDKSIITDLEKLRKYGGEDLPVAQWGALGNIIKQTLKQAPKYVDDFFRSSNKFTSEIDWGAFNKAIPENKILMQEYNLIEETTKANKTWMKNADGSAFAGTPEQFVQMKSGNFQKAFGNSKVQDIVMHRTDEVFDVFDPKKIGSAKDDGFYGRGFYFHPEDIAKKYDDFYGKIPMPSYVNIANPYTGKQTMEVGRQFAKDIDGRIIMGTSGSDVVKPVEYMSTNPNNIKSAIGNDGMFDLTNPDIYKQWGGGLANTIYKFATDSDYEWTDALYDYTLAPLSNALDVLSVPGALVAEAGEYFGERGDKEFNFTDAMPALKGDYSFKNMNDGDMKTLSGIVDDDGNPLVENPWGAFAVDVLTDPSTYFGVGAVKSLVKPGVKASVPIVKNIVKSTDDIVKATADDMVEVFTSDGSKKLIKKADAVRVNRIEDANVNNNTFTNYEDGNWFSDDIQPFYLNNAKNTLKGGVLNPSDPKRVISAYLDPNDAKLFDVTKKGTSTALDMSGGSGNLPVKGEYVLPPALVKAMRSNQSGRGYSTLIGDSESIMNNLTKFYKKLGGSVYQNGGSSVQDNTSVPSRGQVIVNEEDEQIRKDNQVLGLSNILDYLVESRGGDQSIWTNLADNVAFHESGSQQRMNSQARQITNSGERDGLGRGMFQFEPDSFKTAQKRYKNVANAVGYTLDENILNAESALDLSAKDQYTLFFANLIESPAVLKDYADGKSSMTDVWLTGHKNVSKPGNRASFAESQEVAKKELGERGFLQFTLEDLLPYKKGGEAHMFSTYKNYINGKTTSKDAIKIYDKLNRRYLKQARELGMSPANYVMTYIIGNS